MHLDLAAIGQAWDIVFKYHGPPSGIFAADEYLAGLEAARGCVLRTRLHTLRER